MVVLDVSGSMSPAEREATSRAIQNSTTRIAGNNNGGNIRYFFVVVGSSGAGNDPMVIDPTQNGVPGLDPINNEDLQSAVNNLNQNLPRLGGLEPTLDAMYDFFSAGRRPAQIIWEAYNPLTQEYFQTELNLDNNNRRIAIIIGDERAQSMRGITVNDVVSRMELGDAVYVIAPGINFIHNSYQGLLPQENGDCIRLEEDGFCKNFFATPNQIDNSEEIEFQIEGIFTELECSSNALEEGDQVWIEE